MIPKQIAVPKAITKFAGHSERDEGSKARLWHALYDYLHHQGINRNTSAAWATECERKILKRWAREEQTSS